MNTRYKPEYVDGTFWPAEDRSFCVVLFNGKALFYDRSEHYDEAVKIKKFLKSYVATNAQRSKLPKAGLEHSLVEIKGMDTDEIRLFVYRDCKWVHPPTRLHWEETEMETFCLQLYKCPDLCWRPSPTRMA